MKASKRLAVMAAAGAAATTLLMSAGKASAGTSTWDNGGSAITAGGSGTWTTAGNWNPDGVPAVADSALINMATPAGVLTDTFTISLGAASNSSATIKDLTLGYNTPPAVAVGYQLGTADTQTLITNQVFFTGKASNSNADMMARLQGNGWGLYVKSGSGAGRITGGFASGTYETVFQGFGSGQDLRINAASPNYTGTVSVFPTSSSSTFNTLAGVADVLGRGPINFYAGASGLQIFKTTNAHQGGRVLLTSAGTSSNNNVANMSMSAAGALNSAATLLGGQLTYGINGAIQDGNVIAVGSNAALTGYATSGVVDLSTFTLAGTGVTGTVQFDVAAGGVIAVSGSTARLQRGTTFTGSTNLKLADSAVVALNAAGDVASFNSTLGTNADLLYGFRSSHSANISLGGTGITPWKGLSGNGTGLNTGTVTVNEAAGKAAHIYLESWNGNTALNVGNGATAGNPIFDKTTNTTATAHVQRGLVTINDNGMFDSAWTLSVDKAGSLSAGASGYVDTKVVVNSDGRLVLDKTWSGTGTVTVKKGAIMEVRASGANGWDYLTGSTQLAVSPTALTLEDGAIVRLFNNNTGSALANAIQVPSSYQAKALKYEIQLLGGQGTYSMESGGLVLTGDSSNTGTVTNRDNSVTLPSTGGNLSLAAGGTSFGFAATTGSTLTVNNKVTDGSGTLASGRKLYIGSTASIADRAKAGTVVFGLANGAGEVFTAEVVIKAGTLSIAGNNLNLGTTSNGVTFDGAGATLTTGSIAAFNRTVTLSTDGVVSVGTGSTLTLDGSTAAKVTSAANSTAAFIKAGGGTMEWKQVNDYTGPTLIKAGTLKLLTNTGTAASSSGFTVYAGATLQLGQSSDTMLDDNSTEGRVKDSASITLNGGTLTYANSGTTNLAEAAGDLRLGMGQNSINESTSGKFQFAALRRDNRATAITTATGSTLVTNFVSGQDDNSTDWNVGGVVPFVTAKNDFVRINSSTGTLEKLPSYDALAGATSTSNVKQTAAGTGLISSNATVNSIMFDAGTQTTAQSYDLGGNTLKVASGLVMFARSGTTSAAAQSLDSGALDFGTTEGIIHVSNTTSTMATVNVPIKGSNGLTIAGAGTLTSTVANDYSGTTTVNGKLVLTGSGAIANSTTIVVAPTGVGSGALDVSGVTGGWHLGSNQTLKGRGIITGAITLDAGSHLAPGMSPGILSVTGNVVMASNSNFDVEITGTTVGDQYDQLNVTGLVDLGSANLNLTVSGLTAANVGSTFTIVNNDGSDPLTGAFANVTNNSIAVVSGGATYTFGLSYWGDTSGNISNDVVLTLNSVVVPEPTTFGLLGTAAVGLLARRRRQAK